MKKMLSVAIVALLCFPTCIPQVMGWASTPFPLPPLTHGKMAYDALEGTGWNILDRAEIARYARYEDHIADYYHRVGEYQTKLHEYHELGYDDECKCSEQGGGGGAEDGVYHYIQLAQSNIVSGNKAEALRYLGYAIHFIQDSVCPPHVLPFSESFSDTAHWAFEVETALWYDTKWKSRVTSAPEGQIESAEDLRQKVVVAANDVYDTFEPPPSGFGYVRQDGQEIGDLSGTPFGWKMSDNDVGWCMEKAASLVKGAAIWVQTFAFDDYHSYAEIESGLRSLESSGIAKVESIGVSVEGRQIWAVKISDEPEVDDEDEPDVLFVGLHHAREWISAEVPFYLAVNLVQNYQSDESVRTLVDNSEIWIVPVLNPDGLEYSRLGGFDPESDFGRRRLWRKNRVDNGDDTHGVDLNRNYGYEWGHDYGSSGTSSDHTYRGPEPFSEPETRAIRDLILDSNRNFQAVLSYHSYSQLILYPWGFTNEPAPDSGVTNTLATEMSDIIYNVHGKTYTPQQASQLYLTSGDFTDWVYGTLRIPAFTIELRPPRWHIIPGFELPEHEILDTCEENFPAALYLIRWSVLTQGGFMDFEDGVDDLPIRSTIPAMTFTTTMGYDWVYGDIRTGKYNVNPYGSKAYECHGNFFAWLGPNQGSGRIDFTGATAESISMLTSTAYGTYLDAYDSSGNLLASSHAGSNIGTGTLSEIAVTASNIAYVIVHDTGNYWLIDDLRVSDLLRQTNAFQSPDSTSMFQTLDTIDQSATSTYEFTNDQQQTLKILVNWQGSQLGIQIFRPDGTIFCETESDSPPIRVVIPTAEPGIWSIAIAAIDIPFDDYPFAIDVASVPPPPDTEPPTIAVQTPVEGQALQDGVTLEALVIDPSGVDWVTFSIREPDGTIIDPMFESMDATDVGSDTWQVWVDTNVPELPDGYYLLLVNASDMLGNEGSKTVQFSIRNWACLELLPATEANKAGRTMPVKFSLRVFENVDPAQPFVYNEELTILIYEEGYPESILQESTYGDTARDYRIDLIGELYITNFRTIRKKLTTYVVEIYRKDMLIGWFTFETVK